MDLKGKLDTYVYEHRRGIADVVEQALWQFLHPIPSGPSVPREPSVPSVPTFLGSINDDNDDNTRISNIISHHYEEITGASWKQSDREALDELVKVCPNLTPNALRAGICMATLRCKSRVNSLRYCFGPITEANRLAEAELTGYLAYLEKKLADKRKNS